MTTFPGERTGITMVQRALLVDRPRSARGLTLTVLMLFATVVAIAAIAFAAVHSGQSASGMGEAHQLTIGQLTTTD